MAKTYAIGGEHADCQSVLPVVDLGWIGCSVSPHPDRSGAKVWELRSTPVDVMCLMTHKGSRWLVAGYGPANWVANARAAGEVTLSRGGRSEVLAIQDAPLSESVPVLRKYMREVQVTRRYFDSHPDDPDDAIAAEPSRHPVLKLAAKIA